MSDPKSTRTPLCDICGERHDATPTPLHVIDARIEGRSYQAGLRSLHDLYALRALLEVTTRERDALRALLEVTTRERNEALAALRSHLGTSEA